MQRLSPIVLTSRHYKDVEAAILETMQELLFKPLLDLFDDPEIEYKNAVGALVDAVSSGRVWYQDGAFSGDFNAKISKEIKELGGVYSTRKKTWKVDSAMVPVDLRIAQVQADSRYDALRRGFLSTLADVDIDSISEKLKSQKAYEEAMAWMNKDFEKSIRSISIAPKLTEAQSAAIAQEWANNLDLYVKNWTENQIVAMRKMVQSKAFAGKRPETLKKYIGERYAVGVSKAKFLARQETSLLLSKYREQRYHAVGIDRYIWSTSRDERVRGDHSHLQGKIFNFSNPPITNRKTGARNNPGEDFGCRCIAVPVVD